MSRNPSKLSQHGLKPRLLSEEEKGLNFHRGTRTKMLYYIYQNSLSVMEGVRVRD